MINFIQYIIVAFSQMRVKINNFNKVFKLFNDVDTANALFSPQYFR